MLRHGMLLRLGILTNKQLYGSFLKPRYQKSHLNIIESVLKSQFSLTARRFSKVAVTEVTDTAPAETTATSASETVNLINNDATINNTPSQVITEKSNLEDHDHELNSQLEKKILSNEQKAAIASESVKPIFNNDASINNTLRQMLIEKSNVEDEEHENNLRSGKKMWTNEQEKVLYTELEQGRILSAVEWNELRERALAAGKIINQHNIDVTIIGLCISFKQLSTGRSYLKYLLDSGIEPNVASVAKFFRLCFTCSDDVDEDVRQLISSMYDTLRAKHSVFDASTAEHVIQGLAVTQRWKEGLELLDDIKLTCSPNSYTYSTLVKAAFDNDEIELGWEMISKMLEDSRSPLLFVYEAWMNYAHRAATGDSKLEEKLVNKLLHFFSSNDIRLSEDLVKMIRLWFEYSAPLESNWDAEFTTVDPRGMCKSCHQYLRPIALTVNEFESLRSAFMSKAVIGSNVFLKTTPEELARFQEFVSKTAPYDIVIDGLNVSYSAGAAGKGNPKSYARILQAVVAHFVDQNRKVLVLGRDHMSKWPRYHMNYVYDNAHVFLAENLSQDDPFLLYAAMYSGLGTCFISRDLMRSHAFILRDPRLQGLFMRWQKQHQYQVLYVGEGGNVRLKFPLKFNTSTQQTRHGGWHVPYDLDNITPRAQALNPPFQWLCLSQYSERDDDESPKYREDSRYQARDEGFDTDRNERRPFGNRRQFDSNSRRENFGSNDDNMSFKSNTRRVPRETFDDNSHLMRADRREPQRKPQGKWYDEDSDDEGHVPKRNAPVVSNPDGKKAFETYRKTQQVGSDESDDDRPTRSLKGNAPVVSDPDGKKAFETYRKTQQVWSDDESDDDRPPRSRQPERKKVIKTIKD